MKPKCLWLELKRRHGAIVVGLNIFSVILLRPVIIIHWSWPGLGHYVNRWLGDKNMKVFGRTGVRIYPPPYKSEYYGLDTECAWRGGQNVNMDLLHVAHSSIICQKRPKYGSASVARAAKVWFGDSLCILICLSRTGGWTRPLFIPSEVEVGP